MTFYEWFKKNKLNSVHYEMASLGWNAALEEASKAIEANTVADGPSVYLAGWKKCVEMSVKIILALKD